MPAGIVYGENEAALYRSAEIIATDIRRTIGESPDSPAFSGSLFPASIKDNTEALREFADAAVQEALSNGGAALEHWKRVASLAPRFGLARMRIAEGLASRSHYLRDPELISIAMSDSDALPLREKYRIRAAFHKSRGEVQAASREWHALLSVYPEDGMALTELAEIDLEEGDFVKAAAQFGLAVQADNLNADSHLGLSRALMFRGELSGARAACDRALAIAPGNIEIAKTFAMLDLLEGNVAIAIRSLQEFPRNKAPMAESEIAYWTAQAEIYGGRFKSARSRMESAIEMVRGSDQAAAASRHWLTLAQALYWSGEREEAGKAIMSMPREQADAATLAGAGMVLTRIGAIGAASGILADLKGQAAAGNLPLADWLQAQITYASGKACEAASGFQRVKERMPAKPPLEGLARTLAACGRMNEAVAEYRSLAERKAEALFAPGQPPLAGDGVQALLDSGKCLLTMGKNSEARQSLRNYLWIMDGADPGLSTVAEARLLLKSIR